jgi:hypothetical protein
VAAILESRASEVSPDELIEIGLDYLARLDTQCVRAVCRLYGEIRNDNVRRVFRRYLSEQASWDADLIANLTTHSKRSIIKEAVGILAMGGTGSRAWRLLRKYSDDTTNLPRAAFSCLVLSRIEKRKRPLRLFVATDGDKSIATRVGAAKTLAKTEGGEHFFVPLLDLAMQEGFAMREPREIEAILAALVQLDAARAISFLHALTTAEARLVVGRTRTEKMKIIAKKALDQARAAAG